MASSDAILLFLLAFGLVCVWAHRVAVDRDDRTRVFDDLVDAALLACLSFLTFSFFNPQYALLLVPLVLLRLHRLRDGAAA